MTNESNGISKRKICYKFHISHKCIDMVNEVKLKKDVKLVDNW